MSFEKIKKCLTSLKKNQERKLENYSYLEVNILDRERSGLTKNTMNGSVDKFAYPRQARTLGKCSI